MTDKPREQEQCPFCGGKVGESNTLCGPTSSANGLSEKWWCRYQAYTIRHTDKTARVVEAAKDWAKILSENKPFMNVKARRALTVLRAEIKALDGGDDERVDG